MADAQKKLMNPVKFNVLGVWPVTSYTNYQIRQNSLQIIHVINNYGKHLVTRINIIHYSNEVINYLLFCPSLLLYCHYKTYIKYS